MKKTLTFILLFLVLNIKNVSAKSVYDLIKNNPELSKFNKFLDETGLNNLLNQNLPWDWTIFAPNNEAFEKAPEILNREILSNKFFSQNLFMDHILAKNKKSKDIDELTTEITISNKSVQLYKTKNLHVKDMVVVKEDLKAENGVIHIVDCIMFVQPSFQDERLDEKTKKQFPITSCCFQKKAEVTLWMKNFKNKY